MVLLVCGMKIGIREAFKRFFVGKRQTFLHHKMKKRETPHEGGYPMDALAVPVRPSTHPRHPL
jgi:hypothetical protein